jgi:hypothetical protein
MPIRLLPQYGARARRLLALTMISSLLVVGCARAVTPPVAAPAPGDGGVRRMSSCV